VRSVVITGCGVVSPLGRGVAAFWDGLVAGRSAVAPIRAFDASDLTPSTAAAVDAPELDADPDRAGAFAVAAAEEALRDAGLPASSPEPTRVGVSLGTTGGGMRLFEAWDAAVAAGGAPPVDVSPVPYYGPAVRLARWLGARGPVATPQLACASSTHAVALAAEWVATGRADVVLAGGADLLSRFVVAGFNALRATADRARPFDHRRRGLVLGEGAAVVIVESASHAARRGAAVRARILGAGAAADAVHMTAPDREGRGAARAMDAALAEAAIRPSDVDFVSAHGTGTPYNDAMEAVALTRVFGEHRVLVNSIKGAIGHSLGAAGAFEVVVCVEALRTGVVPPTAGLEEPDPACAGLALVHGTARMQRTRVALSTSSGFAGANAALVLGAA
jgi:3-oxoacyl-(acyl-carrier-protein) synthase